MKNDRQIVEIFRERYELTNFFLRKKIPHNQNSSETSCNSRLEILFLHKLNIFLWPPPKSMTNDVYLTPIEENLH